jgi:hypothetical protein
MTQTTPKSVEHLTGIPRDTSREAFWMQCAALRELGTAGRLRLAFDLTEQVWKTAAAGIRRRHPEYSDEEVRIAAIRMRLGNELFKLGFPGFGGGTAFKLDELLTEVADTSRDNLSNDTAE